jgi:hypothetical protein
MKKNGLLVLSCVLLTGVTNSINAISNADLSKIAFGIGLAAGGNYAQKMNEEYSRENKDPDEKMLITKGALAIGTTIGLDILTGELDSAPEMAVKVGALLLALGTQTQFVADLARPIPFIGGLITDPVDENGKEKKSFGAAVRLVAVYVPLRNQGLKLVKPSTGNFRKT